MFTAGKGAISSYSRKLKQKTRSLTETELVAEICTRQKCCGRFTSYRVKDMGLSAYVCIKITSARSFQLRMDDSQVGRKQNTLRRSSSLSRIRWMTERCKLSTARVKTCVQMC